MIVKSNLTARVPLIFYKFRPKIHPRNTKIDSLRKVVHFLHHAKYSSSLSYGKRHFF